MLGKCANVRMCKCANAWEMCKCLGNVQMLGKCANAWGMCKCENVQMCKCLGNVRMCKCANAWEMCGCLGNVWMC